MMSDKHASDYSGKLTAERIAEFEALYDAVYEGDEMRPVIMCGDFVDGSSVKEIPASEIKHMLNISTPTGRTPPNYAALFSENVRENWRRIQRDWGADEPAMPVHAQTLPYTIAESAFRAGRDIGKMNLNQGLFQHQLESLRNTLVMGFDPGLTDSMVAMTCFEGDIDRLAFDIEGRALQQFRPMVINPRRSGRKAFGFGGHVVLEYKAFGGCQIDEVIKHQYVQEAERSKITDFDKRHEVICKKLLASHKKRRKAIRKMLDQIGATLKDEKKSTPQD